MTRPMEKVFCFWRKILFVAGLVLVYGGVGAAERPLDVTFVGFGEDGLAGLVWDATALEKVAEGTGNRIGFFEDGNVAEVLDESSRFYTVLGDSVFFRGFSEGRHTAFVAKSLPAWRMYGDSVGSFRLELAGTDHGIQMVLDDDVRVERPVRGEFVRAFDDTLRNVSMVRERHAVVERLATGDSIQSYSYDICRWFAAGDRLPFAIQYNTNDFNASRLYMSDIELAASGAPEDGISEQEVAAILAGMSVSVGRDGSVTVGRKGDFDLPGEFTCSLVDAAGNEYGFCRFSFEAGDATAQADFGSLGSLPRATYLLIIGYEPMPGITEKQIVVL